MLLGGMIHTAVIANLNAARAVVVIWTPESARSRWVISEANRALEDDKLIVVRSKDMPIRDIPPPFDVALTGLLDDRDAIVRALDGKGIGSAAERLPPDRTKSDRMKSDRDPGPRFSRRAVGVAGAATLTAGVAAYTAYTVYRVPAQPDGIRMDRAWASEGGYISAVESLRDGREALVATWDGQLRVWDLSASRPLPPKAWRSQGGVVWRTAVLPGGVQALSAAEDGRLTLWDLAAGRAVRTFEEHKAPVWSVALLGEGREAVSGGLDGLLKHWDLARTASLRTIEAGGEIVSVAVTRDGLAASGSKDGTVAVWTVSDGARRGRFEKHEGGVKVLEFLPDGRRVLSGGDDGRLRLWDVGTGHDTLAFPESDRHRGQITSLAVLPGGRLAVTGSRDRSARVWDLETAAAIARIDHPDWVEEVALAGDRGALITGCRDKNLRIWTVPRLADGAGAAPRPRSSP